MAGNKGTLEEAAIREESQANFARSLVELLKQHRAVLPTLPEMFERLISNETSETQNFNTSREDEQNSLARRKKADLLRHYKSLQNEMAGKDERIMQLESELKAKTVEVEKLSEEKEVEITRRRNYCKIQEQLRFSKDEYIKELDAREEKIKEQMERITSLENELKSKDMEMELIRTNKEEQIREYTNRFNQLEEQYRAATSRTVEELKELNFSTLFSNEDLTQQIAARDEQMKKYVAWCNELKETFKVLLANKDEELNRMKTSLEDLTQQIRTKDEQVKGYAARCNELTEENKVFLANKDEELKGMKTSYNEFKETNKVLLANKDKELNRMKTSLEDLTQQIRSKDEQVKGYAASNEDLTQLIRTKYEQVKQYETRYNELKERCKVLLANKDEELKKMKTRLAYLSEKQVQKDQRKVEDTAASNRPSEVEKDFAAFLDEDRIDACEKMQEVYGSEEESEVGISYPRLACMIFETAYEEMKETKEAVLALFKVITKNLIDLAPKMGGEYASKAKSGRLPYNIPFSAIPCSPELEYPIDVFDALVLSLKETAHKCDLESLERGVRRKITEKWLLWLSKERSCKFSHSDYLLTQLSDYIKACIRLTWRMVTQVPPMQLEYQSSTLKNIHKNLGYHSSPEMCSRRPTCTAEGQASDEGLEIACYLWPALLDGGGKLIRAGEVVCKVKEENTMI